MGAHETLTLRLSDSTLALHVSRAIMMIIGGIAEPPFGIKAEASPESLAEPLTATVKPDVGYLARNAMSNFQMEDDMVALVALVLILALLGGLGFAVHVLRYAPIVALMLWLIGFFIGGAPVGGGGGRRWYGR